MGVVIGISGFALAGKTTAADYIERIYGVKRKHIAEPLRAMLRPLLQANGISDEMINRYLEGDLKDGVTIPEIGCTSRHLQITLGTEWGRELINPDLWSNTWLRSVKPDDRVMNDSVRFPNEERAIRSLGGFTIMVKRPDTRPVKFNSSFGRFLYNHFGAMRGAHESERLDLLNPDYVVLNNGNFDELYFQIDRIMKERSIEPKIREAA